MIHINRDKYKISLAAMLTLIFLLQYLRNITEIYYLIFFIILSLVGVEIIKHKTQNNLVKPTFIFYLIFLISLMHVSIITVFYYDKYDLVISSFISGMARLWTVPLFSLILFFLLRRNRHIYLIINIYIIFIIAAALSILLQHFLGRSIFGEHYYGALRMGFDNQIAGYASLTGNVTTFGSSFFSAAILLFFKQNVKPFYKSLGFSILVGTALITMSKTGFLMSSIVMIIALYFSVYYRNWKFLFYTLLILLSGGILFFQLFIEASLIMFVNTFGFEFGNYRIATTTQWQDFIPRVTDRLFGVFLFDSDTISNMTYSEIFLGTGIIGGGGVMGISGPTSHNSYFDIYKMGGVIFFLTSVMLIIHVLKSLFLAFKKTNDMTLLGLLISNILIALLMTVYNGSLFHPSTSLPIWISIFYLIRNTKTKA